MVSGSRAAKADQLFTFSNDLSGAQVVTISNNGGQSYFGAYAGVYKGQLGTGPVFNIFCVDVTHDIQSGDRYQANTNFLITGPAGPLSGGYYQGGLASALVSGDYNPSAVLTATQRTQRASQVAYLADNFLNATAQTFGGASGSTSYLDNLTAISLSIWDIMEDGGDGLGTGGVRGNSSTTGAYNGLVGYYETLAASHGDYESNTAFWIQAPRGADGGHKQDYVAQAVPEPGMTTMMGSLGLVVAGVLLRRRRRSIA